MPLVSEITPAVMDSRLRTEASTGRLRGAEQCFRQDSPWYRLNIGYANPLNFGEVHSELDLIKSHMRDGGRNPLGSAFLGRHLVFLGVGVGDTEIAFVDWAVKSGQREVLLTGVDVNEAFLRNFAVALKNRTFEPDQPTFHYRPRHCLFEQLLADQLHVPDRPTAYICLGGTIGNFHDQDALFRMFGQLALAGDTLVLGFQLDAHLEWLFRKYASNSLFPDFVLNYVPNSQRGELTWTLDSAHGVIAAIHDGVEVFRTTKYAASKLQMAVVRQGFDFVYEKQDSYQNACIQVYQKR